MKVVAIVEQRKTEVYDIEKPQPKVNQVLVKIHACALCTFEQRVFTGITKKDLPWVGGHEIFGEIESIGSDVNKQHFPMHTKVAVRVLQSCGHCYYCRRGEENLCTNAYAKSAASAGSILPNGLGEYICVDETQIYPMGEDVLVEEGVLVEPLACVLTSIERGKIELGDTVVVIGGGIMGILHAISAKLSGARVILSEPDAKRAEIAKTFGVDIVIDPLACDPVAKIKEITDGIGAEAVFNTIPNARVVQQAIAMSAPMGRVVMYSSFHPDEPVPISPNWLHNSETVLTGSKSPSIRNFEKAARIISNHIVDLRPLVSESYPPEEADTAFSRACAPDTYRVIIKF